MEALIHQALDVSLQPSESDVQQEPVELISSIEND